MTIMIAVKPAVVYLEGRRCQVRKGRTTAHAGHLIVTGHPQLWQPLTVDFPAPEQLDVSTYEGGPEYIPAGDDG